jgi:cytochrome P450
MNNKLDKYDWFYGMLGNSEKATFPCIKHDVHRIRRGAINPFFSQAAVDRFHPVVQAVTDRLTSRMKQSFQNGDPIPVPFTFRCLTVDIICEYLFGKQLNLVEREDWGRSFYSAWRSLWEMSPLIRQIPWLLDVMRLMPRAVLARTNPQALEVLGMEDQTASWTRELLAQNPEEVAKRDQKTVLWEVAHSSTVPPGEKAPERLAIDGGNILSAGFETTGTALSHLTYGVLSNPAIHKRLLKELEEAIPDPDHMPSHRTLEKLPYFHAVIKEGIRYAVCLPRYAECANLLQTWRWSLFAVVPCQHKAEHVLQRHGNSKRRALLS